MSPTFSTMTSLDIAMEETLVLIVRQLPAAIVRGRIDVDARRSVYGLPARLIGILLLQIAVVIAIELFRRLFVRDDWDWPEWYFFLRLALLFGGIAGAAILCVLFREKRREAEPYRRADL